MVLKIEEAMLITPKLLNLTMLKNVKLRLRSAQVFRILLLKMCSVFGQKKLLSSTLDMVEWILVLSA